MKGYLLTLLTASIFLIGCGTIKQGIQDYNTGKNTPLINGEISPKDQVSPISNAVGSLPIPFAPAAGGVILFLGTAFLTWKRGAAIRKNNNIVDPVVAAKQNVFTGTLQNLANVFAGMFAVASSTTPSTTGSIIQRIWKVALATIGAGGSLAAADPSFMTYLTTHPLLSTVFVGITSGIAGIEKGLSAVPATLPPAGPTAAEAPSVAPIVPLAAA